MPEFLTLLPPDDARALLLGNLPDSRPAAETIETVSALGRITADVITSPHPLPEFPRSTVDGFAVRARDTFGASESLPGYLTVVGEVPMGGEAEFVIRVGQTAIIHTGGMLPEGADAVVMLEYAQTAKDGEIEILRAVADGENVIRVGEDVADGQVVMPKGTLIRPAEIGGLMALGITSFRVVKKIKVGIISSGDEIVEPFIRPEPGQVRDINSHTLAALVEKFGGKAVRYGIVGDTFEELKITAAKALAENDVVVVTAGSSASTRDMTAEVIDSLGEPGVLVHGINTRPGKPTILGVCDGKPLIGLPGNPVSALVNGYMLLVPVMEKLMEVAPRPRPTVQARLTVNIASQAGREDWWPVRLTRPERTHSEAKGKSKGSADGHGSTSTVPLWGSAQEEYNAEPIFGKSNLIFTLATANGLLKIPPDATGLSAGEIVEVLLF